MASKPLSSDKQMAAPADEPAAPELEKKLAADTDAARRTAGDKPAAPSPSEAEDEDDDVELDIDDEDDEDLVVFTAKEAAGALATIYAFVKPYLKNYKKILTFVGLGVLVETLFNVFMPLSLKFLIDDALGEEDFQALYVILGVLAAAGIFTSIVDMPFNDGEFDFVFETSLCHVAEKQVPRAIRELNRVIKTGLMFGSVTSDMAPALIDRYELLRGVKKLGTWWEWSELFFSNGFDLSMHRRDCTDALWAATLAANKGPGQWYADSESLRYSFFDKVTADD